MRYRMDTDGLSGRVIEIVEPCGWCTRKRAGLCQRCHAGRVQGQVGMPLWCQPCYPAVRREQQKRLALRKQNPWKHRGICMDCKDAPVYGKVGWAETCGPCRDARKRKSSRRVYQRDVEKRAARNEYKRQWRQANRDKVRAQKRRAALRRGGETPEGVVRWREEVEAGIRTPDRAPRNARGDRLCLTPDCYTVMTGRAKKCEPCKQGYLPVEVQRAA